MYVASVKNKGLQTKLDLHIEEPIQICIHREDNSPKSVNHHLTLKERPNLTSEDSQPKILYKLVSLCKLLATKIRKL